MPVATYSYVKNVDVELLVKEIKTSAIATELQHIDTVDDAVDIHMVDTLSAGDQSALDGIVASHTIPTPLSALDQAKADAKAEIDFAAGQARARYITVTPGQSAVYIRKAADAKAYIDAGYPVDNSPYPYVTAEKNAKGVSASDAANSLNSIANSWDSLAAAMEEVRIQYKDLIDAATDVATVKVHAYNGKVALDNM